MKVLTKNEFVTQSNIIHHNLYIYDLIPEDISLKLTTKITIIDPEYGGFTTTVKRHLAGITNVKRKSSENGRKNTHSVDQFIKRAEIIHNFYYDYSEVLYINMSTKVKIIDPIHGVFFQLPSAHLQGQGHPKNRYIKSSSKRQMGFDEFVRRSILKHGDLYEYSKVVYKNCDTKVCIIDPIYGEFWQSPYQHLHSHGCPERTKNKIFTTHIDHIIPLSIITNTRKSLDDFIINRPLYKLLTSDLNLQIINSNTNLKKSDFVIINNKSINANKIRNNYSIIGVLIKSLLNIDPSEIISEDITYINTYFNIL